MIKPYTKQLLATPPLASVLPYRFSNGSVLTSLAVDCPDCGRAYDESQLRGELKPATQSVLLLEAVMICHPCKRIEHVSRRIHDDLAIVGYRNGRWQRTGGGSGHRETSGLSGWIAVIGILAAAAFVVSVISPAFGV